MDLPQNENQTPLMMKRVPFVHYLSLALLMISLVGCSSTYKSPQRQGIPGGSPLEAW